MKFTIQLIVTDDDQQAISQEEISILDKTSESFEEIGLQLSESKEILKSLQEKMINHQVQEHLSQHCSCPSCQESYKIKGAYTLNFQTLFGDVALRSPRYHHCGCQKKKKGTPKTFSPLKVLFKEHVSAERLYLETKWASLFPFGKTVDLFKDVFPIDEKLNCSSIKNHLMKVAERAESGLEEEKYMFVEGCERDWRGLPIPEGPISVGLDGGYLRDWNNKKTNFEVIAGKSVPEERDMKFFGFVDTYENSKPKRLLFETLKSQGLQFNQQIEFFSDGAENLRNLQYYLSPNSEHYLDWFHITMRITVLQQFIKGIIKADKTIGESLKTGLERVKWSLWHGNIQKALDKIMKLLWEIEEIPPNLYANLNKFEKLFDEFEEYIKNNQGFIPNYAERRRYDEIISTSFVESTINQVVAKRFCKKQQMQWTKKGAHLMLIVRTKVINGDWADCFRSWYPKFGIQEEKLTQQMVA